MYLYAMCKGVLAVLYSHLLRVFLLRHVVWKFRLVRLLSLSFVRQQSYSRQFGRGRLKSQVKGSEELVSWLTNRNG